MKEAQIRDLKNRYPHIDWYRVVALSDKNKELTKEGQEHSDLISFGFESYRIIDPLSSESQRILVDPVQYYGVKFLNSGFVQKDLEKYRLVSPYFVRLVIETRVPEGRFMTREGNKFIGCDNSTGDAWTEEFDTEEACIEWIMGKELGDPIEKPINREKLLTHIERRIAEFNTIAESSEDDYDQRSAEACVDILELIKADIRCGAFDDN